jgi:hypothetical protein
MEGGGWSSLPSDILVLILSRLTLREGSRVPAVCRSWRRAYWERTTWWPAEEVDSTIPLVVSSYTTEGALEWNQGWMRRAPVTMGKTVVAHVIYKSVGGCFPPPPQFPTAPFVLALLGLDSQLASVSTDYSSVDIVPAHAGLEMSPEEWHARMQRQLMVQRARLRSRIKK